MTQETNTPPQTLNQSNSSSEQAQGATCSETYTSGAVTHSEGEGRRLPLLTQQLEQTLTTPTLDQDILAEQSQILNQLFATIMHDKVSQAFSGEPYRHDAAQQWLTQALRIQKQCTQTLKAKGAIDYMNNIIPHPAPIKSDKRNE